MRWIPGIVLLLLWTSCQDPPLPGYARLTDEAWFRRITLGDGERPPGDSDRVAVTVRVARWGEAAGSLFSGSMVFDLSDLPHRAFLAALQRARSGDSLSLISTARHLPWELLGTASDLRPPDSAMLVTELRLDELRPLADLRAEAIARDAWNRDRELEEQADIARHLKEQGIDPGKSWEGLYILGIDPGKGPAIQSGDLVTVAWTARFLDGRVFDDTRNGGEPLTFRLGDPDQVVHGIESILHSLGPRGRATVLIPSREAFGERGAAGGIVPPFTPVIYELQVIGTAAGPSTGL